MLGAVQSNPRWAEHRDTAGHAGRDQSEKYAHS
jgi:hypothetical protein